MKRMFSYKPAICLLMLICFLWLVACQPTIMESSEPVETTAATGSSAQGSGTISPTATMPVIVTTSPLLPPTTIETSTLSPVPTPEAMFPATESPMPTLLPVGATTLVNELFVNPPCLLPCWWEAVPGETTWQETAAFLQHLGAENFIRRADNSSGRLSGSQSTSFENISDAEGHFRIIYYFNPQDVLNSIRIDIPVTNRYLLNHFFTQYGQPDEIMVSALFGTPSGASVFRVFLFYEQLGFTVGYEGDITETETDGTLCLQQPSAVTLFLWNPLQEPYAWDDIYEFQIAEQGHHYQPFEAAVGMSVEQFYEMFAGGETEKACFQTPKAFWQEIY